MESSTVLAVGCFITGLIQAWGTILQILDRRRAKLAGDQMPLSSRSNIFLSFLLAFGAVFSVAFGAWILSHPVKPVEHTVTVDKPCPPPSGETKSPKRVPQSTGNAKSFGDNSPANTGNGNSYNYGQPPPAKPESQKE